MILLTAARRHFTDIPLRNPIKNEKCILAFAEEIFSSCTVMVLPDQTGPPLHFYTGLSYVGGGGAAILPWVGIQRRPR